MMNADIEVGDAATGATTQTTILRGRGGSVSKISSPAVMGFSPEFSLTKVKGTPPSTKEMKP
jgi:hypothetical protein